MESGGLAVWKQAFSFHLANWRSLLPVFPLLCIPILGDALNTLLISQSRQDFGILPKKALREVWGLLPSLFAAKLYFEGAALLWALVPVYGIIQGARHRQYWAMASNVLVFEGKSGKICRDRCREIVQHSAGRIGVRTLVTIPSLLLVGLLLAWLVGGSASRELYSYGFWGFIGVLYWIVIPLSGAVNTFLYLAVLPDSQKSLEPMSSQSDTVFAKRRSGWIWAISICYMIIGISVAAGYFMIDIGELPPSELAYLKSETTFELIIDNVFLSSCYFAGGLLLLLLRRSAFFLLSIATATDIVHTTWDIYARGLFQVYSSNWDIALTISFPIVGLVVCIYIWKLVGKGVLQ